MLKRKRISAIISLLTATTISVGMMFSVPVYAAESGIQNFETVENTVDSGWRVFGDAGIAPTLETDLGGNEGECLALKADNTIIKGTDSNVRYYISENFDKTKDYTFKAKIYLEESDDVSAYVVRLVGEENNSGGAELSFNSDGSIAGSTNSATWTEGWHELRISVDTADKWYAWLDNNIITSDSALSGSITAEDIGYASLGTMYTDTSSPVTSCIAVDDSEIFNGIVGFSWDINNKSAPTGASLPTTATYANGTFGDTTKGVSMRIKPTAEILQVANTLPNVGAGEVVSYSFDLGINRLSASGNTLPAYYFQMAVNKGNGWINGVNTGMTIDSTGLINFFGVNTGKIIEAGKWHSFKYLFASNYDNTKFDVSLYVDEEYVCTISDAGIPSATANGRYVIPWTRFANNSAESDLYVDNIRFEKETDSAKSITGLNWDVDNRTIPNGSAIYGNAEHWATNALGDTSKGTSIQIGAAGVNLPVMQNVLPPVGAGEVVSYSFDIGIDKFSTASTASLNPYYFQMAINTNNGWVGTTQGTSITSTGLINLFGVNTGKIIEAGKWYNFRYLFASNQDNTRFDISLYVDEEYVCTITTAIPGAAANGRYKIAGARSSNNSTESTLYVDNIKFEKNTEATKNVSGLNWDVTDKTNPLNTNVGKLQYTENVFGDTTKGASAALEPTGGAMELNDVLPTVGAGEVVSYSFDLGIDKLSASSNTNAPYYFQYLINTNRGFLNGKALGMSIDQKGLITFFGTFTGKHLEPGKWHNIKYLMASNADNTTMDVSLYVDGGLIATHTFAVPGGSANARYRIVSARAANGSVESTMYIDNVRFEKEDDITADNISSFTWNMDDKTVPGSPLFYNDLTEQGNLYAIDVFGDLSKASSLAIKPASTTPTLNIANPLSKAVGEAISYSFDAGIDKFSDSINNNPAYILQLQINGAFPYGAIHTAIDSEGKINFFGKDTGKTIDAGKWHNFKYLLVPNQDDTEFYISLCVDGEWICGGDYAIPNAVEGRGYKITFVRLSNNSSESTLYVDNINFSKAVPGVTVDYLTSENLLIDGNLIHGYKGMNASQLRSALTATGDAVVGAIRTADGEYVAADASVTEGMTVTVEEGTSMRSYILGEADSIYEVKCYFKATGEETETEITDGKYSNGTVRARVDVTVNRPKTPVVIVAALYDTVNNRLVNVAASDEVVLTEDGYAEAKLNVEDAANTQMKIMVLDSFGKLSPCVGAISLTSNDSASSEN